MTWVRQTDTTLPAHTCAPPMREVVYRIPSASMSPDAKPTPWVDTVPDGEWNDLWRCDVCRKLWRVGNICDTCDPARPSGRCARGCYHPPGYAWRPATWWQRWRHR